MKYLKHLKIHDNNKKWLITLKLKLQVFCKN